MSKLKEDERNKGGIIINILMFFIETKNEIKKERVVVKKF